MFIQQLFFFIGQLTLGIILSSFGGIILPIFFFTNQFPAGFKKQMCLLTPGAASVIRVFIATLFMVVVVDYVYLFSQHLFPTPESYVTNLVELKPDGVGSFFITFLGLCVMVPLAEEILFRGLIQQIFSRNMSPVIAFLLAGAVFGAAHLSLHLLICITLFGIYLSYIFYATGNLTYCIIAHGVFNAVSFLQLTFTSDEALTEPPFYARHLWMLVVSIILLVHLLRGMKKGASDSEAPYNILR